MSFIRDLTAAASRADTSTATLLRLVKVVASRSGADDLLRWTDKELGGYNEDDVLPTYRAAFRVAVYCDMVGPSGFHLSRVRLPLILLPEDVQSDALDHVSFIEDIGGIESWVSLGDQPIRIPWESEVIEALNGRMAHGEFQIVEIPSMVIEAAWLEVPVQKLRAVTEIIRNRVLDFSLALERVAPDAGEPGADTATSDVVSDVGRRTMESLI